MPRQFGLLAVGLLLLLTSTNPVTVAQEKAEPQTGIHLKECLILAGVGRGGRSPVYSSSKIEQLVTGTFKAPTAGDTVARPDDEPVAWRKATADEKGWVVERNTAYVYWAVESDSAKVMLLQARGHSVAYINGKPRSGDPYNYGYVTIPVALHAGTNHILFNTGRGRVKASLEPRSTAQPTLLTRDVTLPDIVGDDAARTYLGAVPVINPSQESVSVSLSCSGLPNSEPVSIPALSVRKIPFEFKASAAKGQKQVEVEVELVVGSTITDSHAFSIGVAKSYDTRRVTFRSEIDGSVQYYAVKPAKPLPGQTKKPGILLSLHGASVEAIGQARAYSSKSWCHIVAPTNRRPFGFDWEDWGRLDALEVLEHAKQTLEHDESRIWLAGHSMGGHGTWSVGGHFPDKFAAIGPSAGWEDFWSYGGGAEHAEEFDVSELLNRAANPSRTLLRKRNYAQQGVYILHGDADDNVPVTQARHMREQLKDIVPQLEYFEQKGAGHWWDDGHDKGADCLDWRPMFDLFARRRLPRLNEVQHVDFTTVCPEHSDSCHWARIEMQAVQLAPSRVNIELFPNKRQFVGGTENVTRLRIRVRDVIADGEALTVNLDGQELSLEWPKGGYIHLRRDGDNWRLDEPASPSLKGPHRYGWFKNAFKHNFLFVVPTLGSLEVTEWARAKARFDAEQWQYRGNGTVEIVRDVEFDTAKYKDRSVILYGNATCNAAWERMLPECPVSVANGAAKIGDRILDGSGFALVATYPRQDSDFACVGVVGGTGIESMKLTDRLGYFVSGASFPDFILYGTEMLTEGTGGVRAAGFFGEDWSLDSGEVVWNETNEEE